MVRSSYMIVRNSEFWGCEVGDLQEHRINGQYGASGVRRRVPAGGAVAVVCYERRPVLTDSDRQYLNLVRENRAVDVATEYCLFIGNRVMYGGSSLGADVWVSNVSYDSYEDGFSASREHAIGLADGAVFRSYDSTWGDGETLFPEIAYGSATNAPTVFVDALVPDLSVVKSPSRLPTVLTRLRWTPTEGHTPATEIPHDRLVLQVPVAPQTGTPRPSRTERATLTLRGTPTEAVSMTPRPTVSSTGGGHWSVSATQTISFVETLTVSYVMTWGGAMTVSVTEVEGGTSVMEFTVWTWVQSQMVFSYQTWVPVIMYVSVNIPQPETATKGLPTVLIIAGVTAGFALIGVSAALGYIVNRSSSEERTGVVPLSQSDMDSWSGDVSFESSGFEISEQDLVPALGETVVPAGDDFEADQTNNSFIAEVVEPVKAVSAVPVKAVSAVPVKAVSAVPVKGAITPSPVADSGPRKRARPVFDPFEFTEDASPEQRTLGPATELTPLLGETGTAQAEDDFVFRAPPMQSTAGAGNRGKRKRLAFEIADTDGAVSTEHRSSLGVEDDIDSIRTAYLI